jgi:GNAT superfamily N-acetyltransferase
MRIVIRPAARADRATLVGFLQQLQDAERAIHPSRLPGVAVADAYYETLTGRQADILIAESEGRPVGFVAGWLDEDPDPLQSDDWRRHGAISDLFVTSGHRGKGVGQRLLRPSATGCRSAARGGCGSAPSLRMRRRYRPIIASASSRSRSRSTSRWADPTP